MSVKALPPRQSQPAVESQHGQVADGVERVHGATPHVAGQVAQGEPALGRGPAEGRELPVAAPHTYPLVQVGLDRPGGADQ